MNQKNSKIVVLIICIFLTMTFIPSHAASQEQLHFDYGVRLFQDKLYDLAALQFKSYLENHQTSPNIEEAQYLLAESYFGNKQYDDAKRGYLELIILFPRSDRLADAHFKIGLCLEKQGKIEQAMDVYLRVHNYYPKSDMGANGLFHGGRLAKSMGNSRKAESILRMALDDNIIGEVRSKIQMLLVDLYIENEFFDKAIQILYDIKKRPVRNNDVLNASMKLGQIYFQIGYFEESENQFQYVASSAEELPLKSEAWLQVGKLKFIQNELDASILAYQTAIRMSDNAQLLKDAQCSLGLTFYQKKEYSSALKAFELAESFEQVSVKKHKIIYQEALCLDALNRMTEAYERYHIILNDSSYSRISLNHIQANCLLRLARISIISLRYAEAIEFYHQFLSSKSDSQINDIVLLQIGKIYLNNLKYFEDALQTFRSIWLQFPESKFLPEARYLYSKSLEKAKRIEEAKTNYQLIIQQFPGSQWADTASVTIQKVDDLLLWDNEEALFTLMQLTNQLLQKKTNPHLMFDMGMLAFKSMKNSQAAVNYWKDYLETNPPRVQISKTYYFMGEAYNRLYKKFQVAAYTDSAREAYQKVIQSEETSIWKQKAIYSMARMNSDTSTEEVIHSLKVLYQNFPEYSQNEVFLKELASLYFSIDSLEQAFILFEEIWKNQKIKKHQEISLFHLGKIASMNSQFTLSDSLLNTYLDVYLDGFYRPAVLYIKTTNTIQNKQETEAIRHLEELMERYPNSIWADHGKLLLGTLYLKKQYFTKAIHYLNNNLVQDSLSMAAVNLGLINQAVSHYDEILLKLADAYKGLKKFRIAKLHYMKFLRNYPNAERSLEVYIRLAEIAEEEGKIERAVDYFKRVIDQVPSDSSYFALGMHYYRLKKYDETVKFLDKAFQISKSFEYQATISSKIIIALLKQNKTSQADVRIRIFEKSFKSHPDYKTFLAKIFLEKGMAHQRRKNFDLALKCFEKVTGDYKRTDFVPEAQLEIGRTYLITNQTDKALDILTNIPKKYPEHPILAKVYLNLGDQYYRWQQFDNAISAFKNVINDFPESESTPIAMRYLIRLYDAVRLWDAALALTRRYIDSYPEADDFLQKQVQIGIFHVNLKEFKRAVQFFEHVKKNADTETEAEIQYWIGKCYYEMGQFEQAIFEFLKVKYISKPTKLPWATTALYESGMAYIRLGKPEEATKLFQKIIQTEGATSDLGRIARQRIEEISSN